VIGFDANMSHDFKSSLMFCSSFFVLCSLFVLCFLFCVPLRHHASRMSYDASFFGILAREGHFPKQYWVGI